MTMRRPTASDIPPTGQFAAITNPVERICALNRYARLLGTLPVAHARIRAFAVQEALESRSQKGKVVWLADEVNLTHSRISQLMRLAQRLARFAKTTSPQEAAA